jgi:hypothetical protein
MAKIINDITSGLISSATIIKIIEEVNRLNAWLNQIGYENANGGFLTISSNTKVGGTPVQDTLGADDFRIFTGKYQSTLTKGKLDHPELVIKVPTTPAVKWYTATATVQSVDQPAFATIKTFSKTEITFDIKTTTAPNTSKPITVHVFAIAYDKDADTR